MINHVNATLLQTSPFKSPILGLPFAMGEMRLDGERCTLCHSLTSCSCSVVPLGVTEVGDVRQFEGIGMWHTSQNHAKIKYGTPQLYGKAVLSNA